MSYIPTPGTIPHRAAEILRALPPDSPGMSSAQLAEDLGQPGLNVAGFLAIPRSNGYFRATKRDGLLFWSLGDGTPEARPDLPDDGGPDKLPVKQRIVPAAPKGSLDLLTRPAAVVVTSPSVAEAPTRAPAAPPAPPAPLRLALWSDGALVIERGGESVQFDAEETRQIVAYLERLAEAA